MKHPPNAGRLSYCRFSQLFYMACTAHVVTVMWCRLGGHVRCPCVYRLPPAHRVSFSTRAPVQSLTTVNQRRTDPHFRSQLCAGLATARPVNGFRSFPANCRSNMYVRLLRYIVGYKKVNDHATLIEVKTMQASYKNKAM